ncbi:hypothetical protein [Flavobacterium phragmitis]|uniref:Polyketide cyclase / dehydrase and lipid transport n=1 Tax=Flavobacterium phragmitis TaxID=739143 RepID=A0A1I1XQS8_9FLAO|nr:hypothetical protein [Flavobacterium phragmitis]SFE09665.1 hypothetical protein SAMN05216297_12067 [Flavobacterium phragmitis]
MKSVSNNWKAKKDKKKEKEIDIIVKVNTPVQVAFNHFYDWDMLDIFKTFWYIPYFETDSNSLKTGTDKIFTLHFKDLHTARKTLIECSNQISFSVKVDNFSSRRYLGLDAIEYTFVFSQHIEQSTVIHCCYRFIFKYSFSKIIYNFLVKNILTREISLFLYYMCVLLEECMID